jgi:hypothetical protein
MDITVARMVAPASLPTARSDAARALGHYAITGSYAPLLEEAGIQIDRKQLLEAMQRDDVKDLVDLTEPLLDLFCIQDASSLRGALDDAAASGLAAVILVAPARSTDPAVTERYELATAAMVADVRSPAPGADRAAARR